MDNTYVPVLLVLAIGVSGMMIGMSGFDDVWGAGKPQTQGAQDALNGSAEQVNPNDEPVSGPVSSGESSAVGLFVDGIQSLASIAGSVALLPVTLIELGFPAWFSVPLGSIAYLVVGVGLVQFASKREWL